MKRVLSFLIALALFSIIVCASHFFVTAKMETNSKLVSTWSSDEKYRSHSAITENLTKDSIVVFGSSEFQHGQKTKYHPANLFATQPFSTMLIGAGYYQSLSHAITLASIQPDMPNNKVVLIVAPQWFRKEGVKPEAFSSRFSEVNYLAMLQNPSLSKDTKQKIADRTETLLEADPPTQKRIKRYDKMYLKGEIGLMDYLYTKGYSAFLEEKSRFGVVFQMLADGLLTKQKTPLTHTDIDWDAYRDEAVSEGRAHSSSNEFHVLDSYYNQNLKPDLAKRKGGGKDGSYCTSPEYDDLKLFLQVCKELKIEPLIVNIPVNGWWYDYTEFPKEDRQQYYQNIRDIAKAYGAQIADFSDQEYTEYFLEDTIHIGWKGWVDVNESIYQFFYRDETKTDLSVPA